MEKPFALPLKKERWMVNILTINRGSYVYFARNSGISRVRYKSSPPFKQPIIGCNERWSKMKKVLTRDEAKKLVRKTIRCFRQYKSVGVVVRRRCYKLIRFKVAKALNMSEAMLFKRIKESSGLHMTSINDYRLVSKVELALGLEQGVMKIKPLKRLTELTPIEENWDAIYTIALEMCDKDQLPNTPMIERAFDKFENIQDGIVIPSEDEPGLDTSNADTLKPIPDASNADTPKPIPAGKASASNSIPGIIPEMEKLRTNKEANDNAIAGTSNADDNEVDEAYIVDPEAQADLRIKSKQLIKVLKEINGYSKSEEQEYRKIWKTKDRLLRNAIKQAHCMTHKQLVEYVQNLR